MGQVQQSKQHFLKNWQKLDQHQSKIFGSLIEVYQNQQEQVAVIRKLYQNDDQYQIELQKLQQYQQLSNIPGLIKLLEIHKQEEQYLCSNFYKIDAIFEYGIPFTSQLPYYQFIQQVMHTLIELQNRDKYHGDLIPSSFLFKNQVKLFLPNINHYSRLLNGSQEDCYLSPELLEFLGRGSYRPEYNKEKSEIFSIGLITLELILQESIQKIYNFETYQINKNILDDLLQKADNKLISKMLELQPENRPNYLSIYEESLVEMMQQSAIKIENQQSNYLNEISNQQIKEILPIHQSKNLHIKTQIIQSTNTLKNTNPTQRSVQIISEHKTKYLKSKLKQTQKKQVKKVNPSISEQNNHNQIKIHSKQKSNNFANLELLQFQDNNIYQNSNLFSPQNQQFYPNSLQYLTPSQSPNNRYSYKKSHQSSAIKQQSLEPNEYAFLHEQIHVPYNPGSNFLDSSRQQELYEVVSPKSQRPTSTLKDISNKKLQINQTKTNQNIKESVQKKPQLLRVQRTNSISSNFQKNLTKK
ncbi:unnamed protein product [Paramecium primaurelia]|uniref:Protein kinase domain-containing protein n=1 Tax=Paramecium primaurelia TaxID=5886 RepID=A0A8S1P7T4_PARPR|nr:unnamed protein product [Paramecium primaurelia]